MGTDDKSASTDVKHSTKSPSAPTAEPAAAPAVLDGGKRGKRKYSRGLRDIQRFERGYSKASRRVGQAIADGLDTYFKRRENSSYKRRDGALRDAIRNWSKGMSKALREASDAPDDLAKAFDTKSVRRTVKFFARSLSLPFLR